MRERPKNVNSDTKSTAAELNLSIVLRAIASYVEDHFGVDKLTEMLEASGFTLSEVRGANNWGSIEQLETFYSSVYDLLGRDEQRFMDANGYKLANSLGPLRYILHARSPRFIYERTVKDFGIVSTVSNQEMVELSEQSCVKRYTTTKNESRLVCLSRQGTDVALPTIWGLPKAQVKETACVAWGDDYCEYHFSWHRPRRFFWPAAGLLAGIVTYAVGSAIAPALAPYLAIPAVSFPILGFLIDTVKAYKANLRFSDKMTADTRDVLHADSEARKEILRVNERQREWEKMVTARGNQAMAERKLLVEQLQGLQNRLTTNIRGYGHDMGTPLTVLKTHSSVLQKMGEDISRDDLEEILSVNNEAIDRINGLVREMMAAAKAHQPLLSVSPQELQVPELAVQLENRLKALVYGRPIEAAVHAPQNLPATISTDQLMFDRIIDNLLMNASKYTHEGRIEIFFTAEDEQLAIEVRDTGRGIAKEELSKIFEPEGSDESTRTEGSYGLGLSVVTELLAQLGGRLEVESEPGKGSSFKCVLPLVYQPVRDDQGDASSSSVVSR